MTPLRRESQSLHDSITHSREVDAGRRKCINSDWRFCRSDIKAASSEAFNDSGWQRVGLPHSFDLPFFRSTDRYDGVGWYRKEIWVSQLYDEQRVGLEFFGASQNAEIFVNGQRVGEHHGAHTLFLVDITAAARIGQNIIAVRIDHLSADESGGLYRDVFLLITAPVHFAWHATRITTPVVIPAESVARIRTTIENHTARAIVGRLQMRMHDDLGFEAATYVRDILIDGKSSLPIDFEVKLSHVQLWHPDHPNLYDIVLELVVENDRVDLSIARFGFRAFEWTSDRGFFLNGESLYLRGANLHLDHAGWGIALTRNACMRDVQLMKDAGFNFIRGVHHPLHKAVAEACDILGMLYWSEVSDHGSPAQLREMIETHYNHPSIIAWSVYAELTTQTIVDLVEMSHELDPFRPVALTGAGDFPLRGIGDIAGISEAAPRTALDPDVPSLVIDYGKVDKPIDAFDPFHGNLPAVRPAWQSGEVISCACDSEMTASDASHGIVDHQRVPKASWYWYRQRNLKILPRRDAVRTSSHPAVGLEIDCDREWVFGTDALDDCQLIVQAVDARGRRTTAVDSITLTIESGPGEFPTGRAITFDAQSDVSLAGGRVGMAFRSYQSGSSVIRATSPGLKSAAIFVNTMGDDESPRFIAGETPIVERRSDRPHA